MYIVYKKNCLPTSTQDYNYNIHVQLGSVSGTEAKQSLRKREYLQILFCITQIKRDRKNVFAVDSDAI